MNGKSPRSRNADHVERMGVRPQFPKPKAYLKAYVLGPQNWESEGLDRLRRYAGGESESLRYRYDAHGESFEYNIYNVKEDLLRVAIALRWHAIHAALSGTASWMETWRRACAYDYWAMRMDCRNQLRILPDLSCKAPGSLESGPPLRPQEITRRIIVCSAKQPKESFGGRELYESEYFILGHLRPPGRQVGKLRGGSAASNRRETHLL